MPISGTLLQALHQDVPGAAVLRDEVVHLAPVAVQRDVDVGQAGVDAALEEGLVGQLLAVGDHAAEQLALARVGQRREEQLGDARLAAGQDDAVVAHLDQAIDVGAHLLFVEMHAGRRITAELALLVAVARELQVAEIGHRTASSPPQAGGGLLLQLLAGAARAPRAPCARMLDQRLDRRRLRRRKARQARRHRLERLAVAQTLRRLRPQAQHLRRGVVGPRAVAQRIELREALVAQEVDVRAVAARRSRGNRGSAATCPSSLR